MIRVQLEDFDVGVDIGTLSRANRSAGGIASFVGQVRDTDDGQAITAMTLEHYPGMTEKELACMDGEARQRWTLEDTLIIHRHGRLLPGEQIVLVAVAAVHRQAAFEACQFLMDLLKTKAPFWKHEETAGGEDRWVAARASDDDAAEAWEEGRNGESTS